MSDLTGVHEVAQDFLRELEMGNCFYQEEKAEVVDFNIMNLVVLKRSGAPPYFYGFKPSGRPVFTHDLRLAQTFVMNTPLLNENVEKLNVMGVKVEQRPTVWYEGKHVNERC